VNFKISSNLFYKVINVYFIVQTVRKKILLIDDEAIIREVVQSCLEDLARWDVITASSGKEGLIKLIEEKPNAIILDVMMPGMDGLTFLQQLRDNPENLSIPVFLLTVKSELIQPQIIAALGLAGALSKPFDPYELVQKIAIACNWNVEDKNKVK
jgi:CheY-like chemotaxis protein